MLDSTDHAKILEKSQDDKEFLDRYGLVRSRVPSAAYRENYDRIKWDNKPPTEKIK